MNDEKTAPGCKLTLFILYLFQISLVNKLLQRLESQ